MVLNASNKRVLLYVDQKRRDLYSALRIADALRSYGLSVRIAGKLQFLALVAYWKPNVVIYGKHDGYHGDWLRCLSDAYIYSFNTEQGFSAIESIDHCFLRGHAHVSPPAHDRVNCFLTYNIETAQRLREKIPGCNAEAVGCPRLYSNLLHCEPRKVSKKFRVGVILGADFKDLHFMKNYFDTYFEEPYSIFGGTQGLLCYHLLEKLWLNKIVDWLRETGISDEIIVRPRFDSNTNYLLNKKGVSFDQSDDPSYLIRECDVVICGQSTLGLECMMAGVPTISIVRLINPGFYFSRVAEINYVKVYHQPENIENLVQLVAQRKQNMLDLSPCISEYLTQARTYFFNGNNRDESIECIVNHVCSVGIKGENAGAKIDLALLKAMNLVNWKIYMWIVLSQKSRILYSIINFLVKIRFFQRCDLYFGS